MSKDTSEFYGYLPSNQHKVTMRVNGLTCNFHMPKALERQFQQNGEERAQSLPPGAPRTAFSVDEYPKCPESWMHGSAVASSYFVPVEAGHGIWLDMVENKNHTHHVAAVISIQGVNPLTGVKTDPVRLEQYKTKCPVHALEFKQDLFCEKCEHKWPPQNYLSTNNGGEFWLDGFMSEDGVVRQWILTEDEVKGVAAQIIKQERVPAIGIAFYLSKEPKKINQASIMRSAKSYTASKLNWMPDEEINNAFNKFYSLNYCDPTNTGNSVSSTSVGPLGSNIIGTYTNLPTHDGQASIDDTCFEQEVKSSGPACAAASFGLEFEIKTGGGIPKPQTLKEKLVAKHGDKKARGKRSRGPGGSSGSMETLARVDSNEVQDITPLKEEDVKKLEVGAGAKIDQRIFRDPQNLDFWQEQPAGFIYVSYCDEKTAKKILEAGKRSEKSDGFLTSLNLAK